MTAKSVKFTYRGNFCMYSMASVMASNVPNGLLK